MTAVSQSIGRSTARSRDDAAQYGLPRGIAVGVTVLSALVFYALTTHGTFNPSYEQPQGGFSSAFFLGQAKAMIHGHLNVTGAQLPGDCWIYHGRCYGYFGLTPSILRLPLLPLLDADRTSLTPVYMTAALTLAVSSALAISFRTLASIKRTRFITFLGGALAVGLGPASAMILLARPAVYEEAIAWGVAFGLLGIYGFLRWWSDRGWRWATLLVVSLTLGANARLTVIPLAVVLGAGIVIRALLDARRKRLDWRLLLLGATVSIVPAVTCLGVFVLKFHTPFPSILLDEQVSGPNEGPAWAAVRRVNHDSLSGLRFIPTMFVAYVRPDGVKFASGFPFVDFRFVPGGPGLHLFGIPQGSLLPERFSTITDTMPLAVLIMIAGLVAGMQKAWRAGVRASVGTLARSPMTYCIVGTAAWCCVLLMQIGISSRYLADFYPFVVVSVTVAALFLAPAAARLSGRAALMVGGGATVLVAWSLIVNVGLEYQDWWHLAVSSSLARSLMPI